MPDDTPSPLLAFVALTSDRMPSSVAVLAALQEEFPVEPVPCAEDESGGNILMFAAGDGRAIAALMPVPIPWSDLEGPCATAWWWPEATATLRSHTHHLVVSYLGGTSQPLARHVWLTRFVAALCRLTDAVGVYWGAGTLVQSTEAFTEAATTVSADEPAVHLWIDHRVEPLGGRTGWLRRKTGYRFFTEGMGAFDLPEMEIDRTTWKPEDVLDFTSGVVTYLVMRGEPIGDGETVGRTAGEKIAVRHAGSMFDRPGPVMKLDLG